MNPTWLVCNDFSSRSDQMVLEMAPEAQKAGAELILFHIYHVPHPPMALNIGKKEGMGNLQEFAEALGVGALKRLEELKTKLLERHPSLKIRAIVREGEPVESIIAAALEFEVERIVIGTHSRKGLQRWLMGSVAERVVRMSPVPVLVFKTKQERE